MREDLKTSDGFLEHPGEQKTEEVYRTRKVRILLGAHDETNLDYSRFFRTCASRSDAERAREAARRAISKSCREASRKFASELVQAFARTL